MTDSQKLDILLIRSEVLRLRLDGYKLIDAYPIDDLLTAYNGTGPEFIPEDVRKKLDSLTKPFLPAVMVHDVDYTLSDGSVNSFTKANNRLLVNCLKCAYDAHPWYSPRLYALVAESVILYRACKSFGWIAWLLAYNNKMKGKTNNE